MAHGDDPPVREMGTPAIGMTIGLFAQLATPAAPCRYFGRNLGI
jgi:hypothetical protein